MRRNFWLSLILLTAVLIFAFSWWQNSRHAVVSQPEPVNTIHGGQNGQQQANNPTATSTEKTAIDGADDEALDNGLPPGWEDQWIDQLADRRYSEDLALEIMSLAFEFENCGNNQSLVYAGQKLNAVQNEIFSAAEQYCQDLATKYPLLTENQINGGIKFVFSRFPAVSPLGQMFNQMAEDSQFMGQGEFVDQMLPMAIQAKNSQMIYLVNLLSWNRRMHDAPESRLIGSTNNNYLNHLRTLAIIHLSCPYQEGVTCSEHSTFMRDKCRSNELFCGQTFSQWFAAAITPGMKRDIGVIEQFYLEQANAGTP